MATPRCGPLHDDADHSRVTIGIALLVLPYSSMNLLPDQPPPATPKMSAEERRLRHEDRLKTIRLRMLIFQELDQRDISTHAPRAAYRATTGSVFDLTGVLWSAGKDKQWGGRWRSSLG
jgi:hypothetical protein